jgi:DNA (cytosine-5)-methyltransferase 1
MISVELFSCAGGMALGFERAGIRFDHAFDADPNACASYEANLRRAPIRCDVRELLEAPEDAWPRIDLLVADPPCTPWSRSGKRRGLDDERDMLRATCKLIERARPRCFLIGNIPGLDDAKAWAQAVQPVIGGLAAFGYCVLDYTSLDAADFGVPQHRRRPFWFGHPRGTPCLRWPLPTHGDGSTARLDGCAPWVTCRDALAHLSIDELGTPVELCRQDRPDGRSVADRRNGSRVGGHPAVAAGPSLAVTVAGAGKAGLVLVTDTQHPHHEIDAPARVVRAGCGGGANRALALPRSWHRQPVSQSQRRSDPNAPSATVTTSPHKGGAINAVKLSERAAAILQGFPDAWSFVGATKSARWAQIGQAMPPGLAEAVASSIVEWFARDGAFELVDKEVGT